MIIAFYNISKSAWEGKAVWAARYWNDNMASATEECVIRTNCYMRAVLDHVKFWIGRMIYENRFK